MKRTRQTAPFRGPDGAPLAGSIADLRYLRLGGVDQWVLIRGQDVTNPVLVLLHGGPGMSETTFFRGCNAVLEKSFTVVYWDQRGAGRSYGPTLPRSSMTVEQFLADLDELVEVVRDRLGHRQVVLLGHSWGSLLGPLYAARFPEKVSVYVGCAQIGDWPAAESASYAYALDLARRRGNRKAIEELTAMGPPPYSAKDVWNERTWVLRLEGLLPRTFWSTVRSTVATPEASFLDVPGTMRGLAWTMDAMWPEVSKLNLLERVPALPMPVVFFLGRRDRWVPPETSVAYVDALVAPTKKLVWFETSAHEMFVDEPAKFNALMEELVRPLAVQEANKGVMRRIFDAVNAHDVNAILEHYAADYVLHGAPAGIASGIAGAGQLFAALFTAFPDAHVTLDELIAEGDKVVSRITFRGTHQGPLMGMPPTGKPVEVSEVYVSRFAGGTCIEEWRVMDELGLLQQLGLSGPSTRAA